jgi:uncharacterized delta-60 repeat protein
MPAATIDARRTGTRAGLVLLLVAVVAGPARAAGGDLDPSFGRDGRVTTTFAGGASARALAIQPDGKIVAAGQSGGRFGLARYGGAGVLDPTFGGDGRVTTDFTAGDDWANSVAVQDDGRIVAVGHADYRRFAIARYDTDGTLDPTFAGDGTVTSNFAPGTDIANAVAIQSDGAIVVAGITRVGNGSGFAVARYLTDGTPDPSFGAGGEVTTQFRRTAGEASGVAIQSNGRIVAVGEAFAGEGFTLARYRPDGSLDPRFGGDGRVTTRFGGYGSARAIVLQPDGKLVVAGSAGDIFGPFALARYRTSGRLDPTFGSNGRLTFNMGGGEESADDVALQQDGRIVVSGWAGIPHEGGEGGIGGLAVARVRGSGVLDPSFGGDGKVRTHFNVGAALGQEVAIQPNGRIVADGWAGGRFVLARYHA